MPDTSRLSLLRGSIGGETVALALLGERLTSRRRGLVRSRSVFLNETGDPVLDMTIEHNALLVSTEHREAAEDALVRWFVEQRGALDELHIGGSMRRFPEGLVEHRGLGRYEIAKPSYCVELARLAESGGELYPVLSSNARQQLRRATRRFEGVGPVRLERATTVDEALNFFAGLKALHAAAWNNRGVTHSFSRPFFEHFHRLMIERGFRNGAVELLRARAGQAIFGYLYNFRLGARVYAYQSGFAYNDRGARPGAVAHALAIRDAYRSGAAVYDFLAGRNRLKESFSTCCQPMLWQVIQQPRLRFRMEHIARRLKEHLTAADPAADRRGIRGSGRHAPFGTNRGRCHLRALRS